MAIKGVCKFILDMDDGKLYVIIFEKGFGGVRYEI